jgi:polysaccharide biosynthesis protein PelE
MFEGCQRLEFRKFVPEFILVLTTLAAETGLTAQLVSGRMEWGAALLCHSAIVAGIAAGTVIARRRGRDLRCLFLLLINVTFLGPLGCCAVLLTLGMAARYAASARPFEEWHRSLFPEEENAPLSRLREQVEKGTSVAPLVDVLSFGSHPQKQALIGLIGSHFRPGFSPLLKMALADSNNAIRVQAATAITRIESEFVTRSLTLTRNLEEKGETESGLWDLARHNDDYAFAGLLDPDREQQCREQALSLYRRLLGKAPADGRAWIAVGRILVRSRRYAEAVKWFETEPPSGVETEADIWKMESLFHTERFDELRQVASINKETYERTGALPPEAREAVSLWAV